MTRGRCLTNLKFHIIILYVFVCQSQFMLTAKLNAVILKLYKITEQCRIQGGQGGAAPPPTKFNFYLNFSNKFEVSGEKLIICHVI